MIATAGKAHLTASPQACERTLEFLISNALSGLMIQVILVSYVVVFPFSSNAQAAGPAADQIIFLYTDRRLFSIYAEGARLLNFLLWRAITFVDPIIILAYHA